MGREAEFNLDVRGAGAELHLVRDLLDKQLVDRFHDPMGRVDELVLDVEGEGPPQLLCIESGVAALAERLGRPAATLTRALSRRWGLWPGGFMRIPWSKVTRIGIDTELDLEAARTPALAWEHWLFEHVVRYLPSIKPENKEKWHRHEQWNPRAPREPQDLAAPAASEQIPTRPVQQRRVRLHRLLSRKVLDSGGRFAGRVEEVRGHVRNGRCLVQEYVLGREALLERLSVSELSLAALRVLGAHHGAAGRRVPWQQMDLTDPDHPRLRCTREALDAANSSGGAADDAHPG
jgi:sporulation protein YlmC with PRC-barrel domain